MRILLISAILLASTSLFAGGKSKAGPFEGDWSGEATVTKGRHGMTKGRNLKWNLSVPKKGFKHATGTVMNKVQKIKLKKYSKNNFTLQVTYQIGNSKNYTYKLTMKGRFNKEKNEISGTFKSMIADGTFQFKKKATD